MNSEVEQRIVAMYFDNKDFEKNAKQTIDTLGELKDSLDLEDAVKGFDELDKAGRKLNLNQARTNVRNMKDTLAGLSRVLQKSLNIGTAPFRALDNFFSTLRGYAAKFIGFDLGMKFASSLENAIRQLTIAPVEAGWNMYQQNIDSTKTIMSGTLQSYKDQMSKTSSDWTYNEAEHMEYVKGQLKELSEYAQKTVFSLSDMTSNVGKFTNQGVELKTAVTAMEGIANMTAKAGQGAQQASMAMYNFSQALGVGKMTSMDWKSIENANLATTELKQLFIDTAVAAGKLQEEVSEDSSGKKIKKFFITVDEEGKKLAKEKWIEVSAENFREQLSKGWLDKETMLRVFQIYSNQVTDLDTLAAWGFDINDKEMMDYLFSIGLEAERAATQVRTFQKMWDAMTESVQSGWADSMQYIFGDMREATDFWSTVNDKIGEVLDGSAQRRNDLLREWRGMRFDEETKTWKKVIGAVDGREDLVQGIYGVIDALKNLGSAFSNAWGDVFGQLTGNRLQEITRGFRDLVNRFKDWLGDADDASSRISKIRSGLSGIFSIVKIGWEAIKGITRFAWKLVKPIIDPMLNLFDKFGKFMKLDKVKGLGDILKTLRDRFTGLWDSLTKIGWGGVFNKIGEWLGGIWDQVWNGISGFLNDIGLDGVKDWFVNLGVKIEEGYEAVKTWWNGEENVIRGFFDGVWSAIVGLFTPTEYDDGTVEAPIVRFFTNAWKGIEKAFEDIKGWGVWTAIGDFFTGVWNTIMGWFKPVTITGKMGNSWTKDPPIVEFFTSTWASVETAFEEIKNWPVWKAIGDFFTGIWDTVIGLFSETDYGDGMKEAPIARFFRTTWESVKATFEEVQKWEIWSEIGSFFTGVWDTIMGWFTPTTITGKMGNLWTKDPPIVEFFTSTWASVETAFEEIKNWPVWKAIGDFFTGIWDTVIGLFSATKYDDGFTEAPIARFFRTTWESVKATFEEVQKWEIWSEIGSFFTGVWDTIMGWFTPVTITGKMGNSWTKDPPIVEFFTSTWASVRDAFEEISKWQVWKEIGTFFNGVWDTIMSWFTPVTITGKMGNTWTEDAPIVKFFKDAFESIRGVFDTIKEWPIWNTIGTFFSGIFDKVIAFFGGTKEVAENAGAVAEAAADAGKGGNANAENVSLLTQIIGAITDFVTKAFDSIKGIVLPPAVQKVLTDMFDFLNGLITFVSNIFGSIGRILGGNANWSEYAIAGLLALITVIAEVVKYNNLKNLSNIASSGYMDTMSTKFFHIAMGLLAISAAISLLTTVDTGKMWSAVGAIAVLGAVISVIMNFMTTMNMTSITRSETPVNGVERFFTNLVNVLGKAGMLYIALKLLPDVIKAFGEAKKMVPDLEGLDILHIMLGLAALIGGISLSMALVERITKGQGINPWGAIKTMFAIGAGLSAFAFALFGAGGLLEGIDAILKAADPKLDIVEVMEGAFYKVRIFVNLAGRVIHDFFSGLVEGKPVQERQKNESIAFLDGMSELAGQIGTETLTSMAKLIGFLTQLIKMGDSIPNIDEKMEALGERFGNVGTGLVKFVLAWNAALTGTDTMKGIGEYGSKTYQKFEGSLDLVRKILDLFSTMEQVGGYRNGGFEDFVYGFEDFQRFANSPEQVQTFVDTMNKAIDGMAGLHDGSNVSFDGLSIVRRMYDEIQKVFDDPTVDIPQFNATPVVDSIVKALGYGETAIAYAVHAMVQEGLNLSQNSENGEGYTFDPSGMDEFLKNPEAMAERMQGMSAQYEEAFYGKGGTEQNPAEGSLFGTFNKLAGQMNDFEFPDMSGKLAESFSMKDENGKDMDLVGELRNTLGTFQDEINKMPEFEIKIIPIIDLKNLNAETLRTQLANYPIGMPINADMAGGMMRLDFSGLNSAIDMTGLQNKIGEVTSAVNAGQFAIVRAVQSMEGRLDGLSAAISGLRLYLDTGMLVGGITPLIDAELGRRADFAQESGVASMLANPYSRTKMIEMEY